MATAQVLPLPPNFDIHDRNATESWKEWRPRWDCYALAIELSSKPGEVQVPVLSTVTGTDAYKVFNTFQLTKEEKKSLKAVLDAFGKYCQPYVNTALERYRSNLRDQWPG